MSLIADVRGAGSRSSIEYSAQLRGVCTTDIYNVHYNTQPHLSHTLTVYIQSLAKSRLDNSTTDTNTQHTHA